VAFTGISIPSFWLGLILILAFAVGLKWFPASGTETVGNGEIMGWSFFIDRLKYLTLPMLSLTAMQIGTFVRFSRSSMMEAMRNDFVRTARAKGLSRSTVVWRHGFRNALIPVITIIAISFGFTFSGAIITETIFAYQGVGKLVYESIIGNDFNVAMVSFMISISMVLVMNLVADILYGLADPRISFK
jgi:peptide/nickel transport system permease protein